MSGKNVLFGIKNCDTVKKARSWLEANSIEYRFHDLRADGLSKDQLQAWLDQVGAQVLINTRSTTWRQLNEKEQQMTMGDKASAIVLTNPVLIKRPVLMVGDQTLVGFNPDEYQKLF